MADGLEEFQEQRLRMLGIGYRMLGSVTDAEEVLQEYDGGERAAAAFTSAQARH